MDHQNNQSGGMPPQGTGFQQTMYPPQGGDGFVQQPVYPPQGGNDYAQQPVYPPQGGNDYTRPPVYPPMGGNDYAQPPVYPPQGGDGYMNPPVYPPQGGNGYTQPPMYPPQGWNGTMNPPVYPPQGGSDYTQPPMYPPQGWNGTMQSPVYPPQEQCPPRLGVDLPPAPQKPRRDYSGLLRILIALLTAIVLAVGTWFLYDLVVPDPSPTGVVLAGTLGARYSGDCIIVRNETPFDAEGVTSVQYTAQEGSYLTRTTQNAQTGIHQATEVCRVYAAGYSSREVSTLQNSRDEIRDYQKKLLSKDIVHDVKLARVQGDVLTLAKEVRSMIAGTGGSLSNQEKLLNNAIEARQDYLKEKYSDDQSLSHLYENEWAQEVRIEGWTKSHKVTMEGLVSFYSDGYEYALTSRNYQSFTPRQVRAMVNGVKPENASAPKGKTTLYRMVESYGWNVLYLAHETDWNPVIGQTYELQLDRFDSTVVTATVEHFTRSDGELLLYLYVDASVKPVMYMRTCQAELGESISTLRVPKEAISKQGETTGVVIIDEQMTETFIPVNVIWEQNGYVHINAVQQGFLREGMTIRLF